MNFNVVKAVEPPASFTEDYLNSMTRMELMQKYNIGATRCNTWCRTVRKATTYCPPHRKVSKKNKRLPTYISRHNKKYQIIKKLNGKSYYFGTFKRLKDAVEEVERLKSNGWSKS